jgi:putative transposase
MVKNRKLARTISQQGWGQFRLMCEAKSTIIEDREVSVISRWEPTSQLCSDCGYHWGKLDLSVRDVVCLNCGTLQDRDINASKNIAKSGVGLSQDSKWTGRARKTGLPAMPDEPSTSSLVTV